MPGEVDGLLQAPLQGASLQVLAHHLIAGRARRNLHVVEMDSAHVGEHLLVECVVRLRYAQIEFVLDAAVLVVLDPVRQSALNRPQIANGQVGGRDGVVAQCAGVHPRVPLGVATGVKSEARILDFAVDKSLQCLFLFVDRHAVGVEIAIIPVDGEMVVHAQCRRCQGHATVGRLRDVVVVHVVHYGGGKPHGGCEACVAERVGRVSGGSAGVVKKSQHASGLSRYQHRKAFGELFGRQAVGADRRVDCGRLHKTPPMEQSLHVGVDEHGSVHDLSRIGIEADVAHRFSRRAVRNVADARIPNVVGVETGLLLREIDHLKRVSEANSLERLVPTKNPFANGLLPCFGESVVQIEADGGDRFGQSALGVGLLVLRDEVPAV